MSNYKEFKHLSVLYAEDDHTIREIIEQTLALVVNKVHSVSSGTEALQIYNQHPVDIVILDIYLGKVSGIDVAQQIRKLNDKIPIIIVSGSVATEDLLAACKLNLIEYIQKPIEFNSLMNALQDAVKKLQDNGMIFSKINENVSYDYLSKSFVYKNGTVKTLTRNEIKVVELLLGNRGQIIPYDIFFQTLDPDMSDGALKNLIFRIRKKMKDDHNLYNLSKIGYSLF